VGQRAQPRPWTVSALLVHGRRRCGCADGAVGGISSRCSPHTRTIRRPGCLLRRRIRRSTCFDLSTLACPRYWPSRRCVCLPSLSRSSRDMAASRVRTSHCRPTRDPASRAICATRRRRCVRGRAGGPSRSRATVVVRTDRPRATSRTKASRTLAATPERQRWAVNIAATGSRGGGRTQRGCRSRTRRSHRRPEVQGRGTPGSRERSR
jgi:hypothetical protein